METKERIIELVRQNVISMEEALDLLEASGEEALKEEFQAKNASSDETEEDFAKEYQASLDAEEEKYSQKAYDDQATEIERLNEEIKALNEQVDKKSEALTIAQQRIREFEVLSEIDPLTDEMKEEVAQLERRRSELDAEIKKLYEDIDRLKNQRAQQQRKWVSLYSDDVKEFFDYGSEKITDTAKTAEEEGRRLGSWLKDSVKDFMNNFNMKDVQLNINIPWVKKTEEAVNYEIEAGDITGLEIRVPNGNFALETHPADTLKLEGQALYYGNLDEEETILFQPENFLKKEYMTGVLAFNTPRIQFEGTLFVPEREYQKISIDSWNGNLALSGLNSQEIQLNSKNGHIIIEDSRIKRIISQQINGKILLDKVHFDFADLHTYNGDIRLNHLAASVDAQTLAGNIYVSQRVPSDGNMNLKTVRGDIKVSLPETSNVRLSTNQGAENIKSRLSNVTLEEDKENQIIQRFLGQDQAQVNIQISQTTGDVYLKDVDQEGEEFEEE